MLIIMRFPDHTLFPQQTHWNQQKHHAKLIIHVLDFINQILVMVIICLKEVIGKNIQHMKDGKKSVQYQYHQIVVINMQIIMPFLEVIFFFIASTLSSAKAFCSSNADCVGFHRTMSQAGYYIMRSGDWEVDSNFEGWKKDCTARNAPAQCITTICDLQGKIDSIYDAVITTSAHGFEGNNAIDFDVNNKKITFSFTHFEFTLLVFVIALSLASIGLCILFAFRKVLTNQRMEYSKVQNVIEEQ
eukprot:94993_1